MANQIKQLYELQQIELEIEQKQGRLAQIQIELSDREAVAQAEAKLDQEKKYLSDLNQEQKSIEWQVEDFATKAKAIKEKLYGGQVKIPKELVGLQKDLESLVAKQRQLEDKVLDIMGQSEEAVARLAICEKETSKEVQLWQESQNQLKKEQEELEISISALEGRRDYLHKQIDADYLSLYSRLRSDKAGLAVARVEQGICLGCRISLPLSVVQRARLSEEIVHCPSCNRILT